MEKLNVAGLMPAVAKKITPMFEDMLREYGSSIHSIHVVGSAVNADYDEKRSDINSVVMLHSMDLRFVEFLAPLGRKYGKKGIAAPLVSTPEYTSNSLDAFPIEFHDFKLIHRTVFGEDILSGLAIHSQPLRLQCEREIKTKIIGLRQGYISSLGKKEDLSALLIRSFTGSMPLFRAIISLLGKEPPVPRKDVVALFSRTVKVDEGTLEKMLKLKAGLLKASDQELRSLFEQYYTVLESTGKIIDELPS
jgi:predicted nucleotidyltransferase